MSTKRTLLTFLCASVCAGTLLPAASGLAKRSEAGAVIVVTASSKTSQKDDGDSGSNGQDQTTGTSGYFKAGGTTSTTESQQADSEQESEYAAATQPPQKPVETPRECLDEEEAFNEAVLALVDYYRSSSRLTVSEAFKKAGVAMEEDYKAVLDRVTIDITKSATEQEVVNSYYDQFLTEARAYAFAMAFSNGNPIEMSKRYDLVTAGSELNRCLHLHELNS